MKKYGVLVMAILFTQVALCIDQKETNVVYKWIDRSSQIHFSNTPHINATKVQLKPINVIASDKTTPKTNKKINKTLSPVIFPKLILTSPKDQETFRNNLNNFVVQFNATAQRPLYQKGGVVALYINDIQVAQTYDTKPFIIPPLERGTHTAQLKSLIRTRLKKMKVVATSDKITIYVHRTSVLRSEQNKH